jgi:hypothetical protein
MGHPAYLRDASRTGDVGHPPIIGVQSSSFGGADIAGMTPIEDVFKIIEQHSLPKLDLHRGDGVKPK